MDFNQMKDEYLDPSYTIESENPEKNTVVIDSSITPDGLVGDHDTLSRVFENLGANLWGQFFRYFWIVEHMPYAAEIADIGCGYSIPARIYHMNKRKMKSYVGVDGVMHPDAQLQLAKLKIEKKIGRKPYLFCQTDLVKSRVPLKDQKFDCVVSTEFIEHIPDEYAVQVLEDAYRILKPGGTFILTTPGIESEENRVNEKLGHVYQWFPEELRLEVEKVGFKVQKWNVLALPTLNQLKKSDNPLVGALIDRVPRKILRAIMAYAGQDFFPTAGVNEIYGCMTK